MEKKQYAMSSPVQRVAAALVTTFVCSLFPLSLNASLLLTKKQGSALFHRNNGNKNKIKKAHLDEGTLSRSASIRS